jgi:Cu/Ag efflux pump CusA
LVDTAPDLAYALNALLLENGVEEKPYEVIGSTIVLVLLTTIVLMLFFTPVKVRYAISLKDTKDCYKFIPITLTNTQKLLRVLMIC